MTQEELLRRTSGTHVLLIARCPGRSDVVLFDSGRESESRALCCTAIELLHRRKQESFIDRLLYMGFVTVVQHDTPSRGHDHVQYVLEVADVKTRSFYRIVIEGPRTNGHYNCALYKLDDKEDIYDLVRKAEQTPDDIGPNGGATIEQVNQFLDAELSKFNCWRK